jgi:twitching motility protein PilT
VLTTVHAGDCVGAIERLVSVFPADEQFGIRRQLSLVLKAIVAQHLIVADGSAGARGDHQSGRRSRVVLSEVLTVTPAVANLIAMGKSAQVYAAMETGTQQGMQTMDHDIARLWVSNFITETTATSLSRNPNILRDRAALLRRGGGRPVGGGVR